MLMRYSRSLRCLRFFPVGGPLDIHVPLSPLPPGDPGVTYSSDAVTMGDW